MAKPHVSLDSAFQDLCDRFGADDPTVREVQAELEHRKASSAAVPFEERRLSGSNRGVWGRQDAPPLPGLHGHDGGRNLPATWPETHESPPPPRIGPFAGSLLHRSDWERSHLNNLGHPSAQ
jgi:hypothetical protein